MQASSHLTLKAIYSRSLKSAQSLAADVSVDLYSEDFDQGKGKGFDAVLSRSDIHAVIIALPILVQPEYIKKAIAAGKHVLSEKPIAKDVQTAKDLIDWYGKNKMVHGQTIGWSVAENFRYIDSLRTAREEREKLGKILEFRLKRHTLVKGGKYFGKQLRLLVAQVFDVADYPQRPSGERPQTTRAVSCSTVASTTLPDFACCSETTILHDCRPLLAKISRICHLSTQLTRR